MVHCLHEYDLSLRPTFFAFGAELLMQMKTLVKHKPVMIALYPWAMVK